MKAVFICLAALMLLSSSEALRCFACSGRGCSPYREECGSLLQTPVCARVDSPNIFMRGCMSEYICRGQQQQPGTTATCCSYDYCN